MTRPVPRALRDNLILDLPVTPAARVDFGIDTDDHYRALRSAVLHGATADDLDAALGDSPKIEALVARFAPDHAGVRFATAWDLLGPGPEEGDEEDE